MVPLHSRGYVWDLEDTLLSHVTTTQHTTTATTTRNQYMFDDKFLIATMKKLSLDLLYGISLTANPPSKIPFVRRGWRMRRIAVTVPLLPLYLFPAGSFKVDKVE
jgi:hypothetical protein